MQSRVCLRLVFLTAMVLAFVGVSSPVLLTPDMTNFQFFLNSISELTKSSVNQITTLDSKSGKYCMICKAAVTAVKFCIDSKMFEDQVIQLIAGLCTVSDAYPKDVCFGIAKTFMPTIINVLKTLDEKVTVDDICGFVISGTCVYPSNFLPTFDWNVTFPSPQPPDRPALQPNPSAPKVRILHMSDTHWDRYYTEGAVSNCKEPICCRPSGTVSSKPVYYAGKYGEINGTCDVPLITVESMLNYAANNLEFDLVYWTGDVPPHDSWEQSQVENTDSIKSTCNLVKSYFNLSNKVFASCGNHEAYPVDSFPVPRAYRDSSISDLYNELYHCWSSFVPSINQSTILKGGFYAYDVLPGLRLISLNMNYCNTMNFFLLLQSQDPADQLQWLIEQLDDCEKKNIKAHIIGHIPPGMCAYVWARNYHRILVRYKETIAGHFYGHTHADEFEIIQNDNSPPDPISIAYIGPSITTYGNYNPAFRVYTTDSTTWLPEDYEVHYLDISKANAEGVASWKFLYNAKSSYGMPDLSASSFNDLVDRMAVNDSLFQMFNRNYRRVLTSDSCTGSCKSDILCCLKLDKPDRNPKCAGGFAI